MADPKYNYPFPGTVIQIALRPSSDSAVELVDSVVADFEAGLIGDRFNGKADSKRQVTLIQQEHLDVVAGLLQIESVDHQQTRRNILVSGINLTSLKEKQIQIGEATFLITGGCPPCSKMETTISPGALNAMRGHGGVTATVLETGTIKVGDSVKALTVEEQITVEA